MENFDQSGSRNNSSKDGPASPPQIVNAAIGHEAIKTTSSATKAQGKSTPRITLGDQALELREQSFKLLSDYSILRGEFLTSANEPNNPNTTAFEQAGLTDNYLAQVKFQAKLERLYRKIIGIVASKEEPIPGNVVGRKLAEMKESFEKDVTRMKALRSTLEAANKGNNGVYKYKAGVRYQLIGEEKPDVMPKRKPAVERKKRASNVVEEGDDLSVRRNATPRSAKKSRRDAAASSLSQITPSANPSSSSTPAKMQTPATIITAVAGNLAIVTENNTPTSPPCYGDMAE